MNLQHLADSLQTLGHDATDVVTRAVGAVEEVTSGPVRSMGAVVRAHDPRARHRQSRQRGALIVVAAAVVLVALVVARRRRRHATDPVPSLDGLGLHLATDGAAPDRKASATR
jgi:hypothetical protein